MFWAIMILFGVITSMILYLILSSFPKKANHPCNASELIEELTDNRMMTTQGDVVFCYRLRLPEMYSLPEETYDHLIEVWRVALKDLPQGTIIMRSDRYDRGLFDVSGMPEDSYIQQQEKAYAATRMVTRDTSYLFVVYTGFRAAHNQTSQNPFIPQSHREFREEDGDYGVFTAAVESLYSQLQGSGVLDIHPLAASEVREYTQYFFNGYQSDFLTDVDAGGGRIKAGDHFVGAVSIEHERQFPEFMRTPQSGHQIRVPVGLLEDLGCLLPIPHIYNQIISISGHEKEYELIKHTIETFRKNRGFSDENNEQTERLDQARKQINDKLEAMLVRGHTNIIFWAETEQQVKAYRTQITNYLKQVRDFEPVVPQGVELRNIVYCSHPATIACMDRDAFYLVDLKQIIALFQNCGGYTSDPHGVFLSDPIGHAPLRYDLYDAHKKYVDSKNIAVIGRTGGGKSVVLEKIVEAYHNDRETEYINIIVDCGGSYDKAARLYDPAEVFIFRYSSEEPLGLDPFAAGENDDNDRVDDICETLWLIIKPGADPSAEERVSLRKVVISYLHISRNPSWPEFYVWVRDNYKQILEDNEIRAAYFDVSQFVHNGSEWCAGGIYGNVFAQCDNPTTRLLGKRLLIFELENIKSKPQLLSVVVHLIGVAIRTLIWEQTGKRGFIIYEEFAELMKIDVIFSAVLYQMQAIRKKGGSACIVLQNLDQLAMNAGDRYRNEGGAAKALMKNIETVIFLAGADPSGFEQYSTSFTAHDRACILALRNNYTTTPMYSSFYIFRSKKSTLATLSISPRTYLAFQTEGEICEVLGQLYAETGSMAEAIEMYEQKQQSKK